MANSSFTVDGIASGGSGTVTNIATNAPITGGPITTNGTISLANAAVVPGTYTNATITVDSHGLIQGASSNNSSYQLLSNQTGASAASIAATGLGAIRYASYYIVLNGILPATAGASIYMQTSTNNGVSYDTAADYSYVLQSTPASTGATTTSNASAGTYILLGTDITSLNMELYSESFTNTLGFNFSVWGQGVSANNAVATQTLGIVMGYNFGSTNINAFRIIASSGNISGTVLVYGLLPTL